MKNQRAFEIPPTLEPQGRRCVLIEIPDERTHIANFWGALISLTQWRSWKRDDEKSGKTLAKLWKGIVYPAWEKFEKNECCHENEAVVLPPKIIGSGSQEVGQLGLTIEELEEIVMGCLDITGSIRGNPETGKIEVWSCHDGWVPIPGFEGVSVQTTGAVDALAKGLGDLIADPALSFSPLPGGTPPEGMTTGDSVRCAKATAMQDGWYLLMNDMSELLSHFEFSAVGVAVILEFGAEELLTGGWAAAAILAANLVALAEGWNIESIQADMADQIADTPARTEIICQLTEQLSSGTNVTADDVRKFHSVWLEVTGANDDLKRVMWAIPNSTIRSVMAELVYQTPCACDDYIPSTYTPPVTAGCFLPQGTITGDQNLGAGPVTGEFVFIGHLGSGSGENWVSSFQFASGGLNYDAISILIEGNLPFSLSDLKVTYHTAVSYSGGSADPVAVWLWRYDAAGNQWHQEYFATNWADGSTPIDRIIDSMDSALGDKWAFEMRSVGASSQGRNPLTITAFTISGTAENDPTDVGFVDLPIGQEVCM